VNEPFFRILRQWWWVPVAMLGVSVAAGLWWTSLQPQVYRASAMLVVIPNSSVEGDADVLRSLDALERRTLLATFARLPGTPQARAAVAVAVQRDPRDVATYQIGASVLPNTNIIRIDVDGLDPELAAQMANAAGVVAATEARSLYRIYTMRQIAAAEAPREGPIHPDPRRNSLAAGVAGLFIGILVVGVIGGRGGRSHTKHS
jgi:capsular polysaccharide biosynthesis protein